MGFEPLRGEETPAMPPVGHPPAGRLEIRLADPPVTLTLEGAELMAVPPVQVSRRPPACQGASDELPQSYAGVPLGDLLNRILPLDQLAPEDQRCGVLIAEGGDGYRCVLSWGEVFNRPPARQALVAFIQDTRPLLAPRGPLALVVAEDLNSGPRFIKDLQSLELRILRAAAPPQPE